MIRTVKSIFHKWVNIPVNDPDGDEVRCRWSESSKRECADVCHAFPGGVLDEV